MSVAIGERVAFAQNRAKSVQHRPHVAADVAAKVYDPATDGSRVDRTDSRHGVVIERVSAADHSGNLHISEVALQAPHRGRVIEGHLAWRELSGDGFRSARASKA